MRGSSALSTCYAARCRGPDVSAGGHAGTRPGHRISAVVLCAPGVSTERAEAASIYASARLPPSWQAATLMNEWEAASASLAPSSAPHHACAATASLSKRNTASAPCAPSVAGMTWHAYIKAPLLAVTNAAGQACVCGGHPHAPHASVWAPGKAKASACLTGKLVNYSGTYEPLAHLQPIPNCHQTRSRRHTEQPANRCGWGAWCVASAR